MQLVGSLQKGLSLAPGSMAGTLRHHMQEFCKVDRARLVGVDILNDDFDLRNRRILLMWSRAQSTTTLLRHARSCRTHRR